MRFELQDLRIAARPLLRRPGFTAAALATLALGIGGNAAIFSIVDRILLRPLPFPGSSRLVLVHDTLLAPGGQLYRPQVLPWHWFGIVDRAKSLDRTAAIRPERMTWLSDDAPVSFQGARVSAGTFDLLGVHPAAGRLFGAEEDRLGSASDAALISDRFWRTRLGARPGAIGGPLRLGDRTVTVVGVFPPGFRFPYGSDVWRPLTIERSDPRDLFVLGRLASGATVREADAEVAAIAQAQEPDGPASIRGRGMDARLLADELLEGQQRIPLALLVAMGFLLLLACANVASLVLVRSVARQREAAIRAALGAGVRAQMRLALTETLLISMAGGALGLLFARVVQAPLAILLPRAFSDLPAPGESIGVEVALFSFGLSTLAGLVSGIVPAWRSGRADPALALGGAGRSFSTGAGTHRWLAGFVVAEIALATLLLGGGSVMAADFLEREHRSSGLLPDHLLSLEIPLGDASEGSADRRRSLVESMLRQAGSVPGVASAAVTTANPFSDRRWGVRVAPERTADSERDLSTVNLRLVTPGLFRTYGTPVLAGRDVSESDRADSPPVVVVSGRFARRFWKGKNAVGQRLYRRAPDGTLAGMAVVGVVGDIRDSGDVEETLYLPYSQAASLEAANTVYLMVRGAGASDGWSREIPRAMKRVDPRLGVAESGFMRSLLSGSAVQSTAATWILSFLGGFGLLLASTGIFAVVSFAAAQRRSEFGIRAALGATPSSVRWRILRQGTALATAGCAIGLPLALAAGRVIGSTIGGVQERRLLSTAVALALFLVATAAADIPARRASRRDLMEALRGN